MKVLFKNRSFGGGAPKSLLSYIKLLKKHNIDVMSVGQFNYEPEEYTKEGVPTKHLDYFILAKPLLNYRLLNDYIKIINEEKPDLIHATTIYNLYFQQIIEKIMGIPSIYMIPGGKISPFTGRMVASLLKEKKIIVYSKENKQDLLKQGVKEENILHISNRIDFSEIKDIKDPEEIYNKKSTPTVNALMISRFSETKINSIRDTIQVIKDFVEQGMNIELTILGDGLLYEEMVEETTSYNEELGKAIFHLPGYQSDVHRFVTKSHIVLGKGRSILDGIIQKRFSVVVTEKKQFFICNSSNFQQISDYNITGRNWKELTLASTSDLKKLFEQIQYNNVNTNELEDIYQVAKKIYDVNEIEDKVLEIYQTKETKRIANYNPSKFSIVIEFLRLYSSVFFNALKR